MLPKNKGLTGAALTFSNVAGSPRKIGTQKKGTANRHSLTLLVDRPLCECGKCIEHTVQHTYSHRSIANDDTQPRFLKREVKRNVPWYRAAAHRVEGVEHGAHSRRVTCRSRPLRDVERAARRNPVQRMRPKTGKGKPHWTKQ